MFKQITVAAVASVVLLASSADAGPTFNSGSITLQSTTSTQTDLGSTTVFTFTPLGPDVSYQLINGAGDFSIFGLVPIDAAPVTAFDIDNPGTFSFDATASGFGSFAAGGVTNVSFLGDGTNNVLNFLVTGNYTVGSSYSNSGDVISAGETFILTQTVSDGSDDGNPISISATFQVPEPATFSMLGAGLVGLGLSRRYRQ